MTPYHLSYKAAKSNKQDKLKNTGEAKMYSLVSFSYK